MNEELENKILEECPPYNLEELNPNSILEESIFKYLLELKDPIKKETEIVNALLNILACGQKERMAKNCRERYEKRYRLAYMRDRINLLL